MINQKYFIKIIGFIISVATLLVITPSAAEAAVECGWDCSGTTASCKAGGEETWIGYCPDGTTGTCREFCQGSIDADVNCGGVIQHISCDTLWKDQEGCCRRDPPPTRTPTPTSIPSPTPSPSPTPTTPANPAPIGSLDSADCTSFKGWACDASNYNTALEVHFYDGDFYAGGAAVLGKTTADQAATASIVSQSCGGTANHGFEFTTPASLKDGQSHNIYAYAIDTPARNNNPALTGSPKTITCAAAATPTPPPACRQNASIALPAPAAPTPTTAANQAGKIKLTIRFQGIEYDNIAKEESKKQKVKVSVIKQASDPLQNVTLETIMSKSFDNVEVTAEKDPSSKIAVWKGEFTPAEVPAGANYTILVKGPKHLQRKFCINNPTERVEQGFPYRCLGTGKISLSTSENVLNFAGVLLQAGDLPVQDGIVNAYDVSRVLDILRKGESRKEEDLRVADMDLNGVVNAKDRSYLIETLEEKYGDEE